MNNLDKRVQRLEKRVQPEKTWTPAPMIVVHPGESAEEKIAEYKKAHNHTGDDFTIFHLVKSPEAKKHDPQGAANE
jgi:hypothetical protein